MPAVSFGQLIQDKIVIFDLKKEINPAATRITQKAVRRANEEKASLILVHMNTYGGYVTDADSIRTTLLNSEIPVYVFIDNNAASAGALISLACDKIYMRKGASIGATTVVTEDGAKAPDKYQSYMRKQMRSTAESQGYDTLITGTDTTYTYRRNPDIAEGMVDESIVVPGLDDSLKVITLTTEEAIEWGYCEGVTSSIEEILQLNNLEDAEIIKVEPSVLDNLISFLANPALRSIFILLMIGGIYFELQTPGLGFPIAAAFIAAIAYFAPLYLDGLAANWEILLFIIGVALIAAEVFVIPGFGIAGVSGILLTITGLVLSMINNINLDFSETRSQDWNNALASVFFALLGLAALFYFFGSNVLKSKAFQRLVLQDTITGQVKIQTEAEIDDSFIGKNGTASTAFRPMGNIHIEGKTYKAKTFGQFIDQGCNLEIIAIENHYLVVKSI
ncbi:MAG: membrane-bound serine protease (ClpP class) [Bacteroidia bacterium]|mgnify:FL=1|jgi:membrane-bound serine protease (ClpP class)